VIKISAGDKQEPAPSRQAEFLRAREHDET